MLGLELRLSGGLVRPTPHRCSSSSPVEGSEQDPIDNPDWPIIVLSDHDSPVSDAVRYTDPKDLALEPDLLLPGHHSGPVGSDPASASDELPEWGRLNRPGISGDSIALKEDGVHDRYNSSPEFSSLST
jgi:hypothetical protein